MEEKIVCPIFFWFTSRNPRKRQDSITEHRNNLLPQGLLPTRMGTKRKGRKPLGIEEGGGGVHRKALDLTMRLGKRQESKTKNMVPHTYGTPFQIPD